MPWRVRVRRALDDPFATEGALGGGKVVLDGTLRPDPVEVAIDSGFQVDSRLESEGGEAADVGDKRAHFAGTVLAGDVGFNRLVEFGGEGAGELSDLGGSTGADVEHAAVGAGIAGDEEVGPRHVFDKDQVA